MSRSRALAGMHAPALSGEVHLANDLPAFTIVGRIHQPLHRDRLAICKAQQRKYFSGVLWGIYSENEFAILDSDCLDGLLAWVDQDCPRPGLDCCKQSLCLDIFSGRKADYEPQPFIKRTQRDN